jgi:monoamine oxidase
VYEANAERAGGRCWTLRDFFEAGRTEHGGAFIDTTHLVMRRLAARLGLQTEVVNGGDLPAGEDIYWIEYQGFLEGAVESGERAARELTRQIAS